MKVRTKQDLCRNVAQQWRKNYERSFDAWPDKKFVYLALQELNGSGTEEQIAKIIGNDSWTRNKCDECGKDAQTTVQLGAEPDHDTPTVFVCLTCIKTGAKLAEMAGKKRQAFSTNLKP